MRIPTWFALVWVTLFGLIAVGASFVTYRFVRDFAAEADSSFELPDLPQLDQAHDNPEPDTPSVVGDATTDVPGNAASPAPESTLAVVTEPIATSPTSGTASPSDDFESTYRLQDPRRKTILLLGVDQRAGEEGPSPTDTIMLFSLDPVGQTGAILSIPRDLWIEYPGLERSGRINTANIVGDEINYPGGGGPALAVRAVEKELGIRIQYYVLINFEVFNTLVDAIGPIEVCPPEPIDDDRYPDGSYGYISIHFDAGCQELDSERLLQYARTRHADSDIGRSRRQQEVIMSIRNKVLSTGGVKTMILEAVTLWESVQANVRTSLTFEEMIGLALMAEDVPSENIHQDQITFEDVEIGTTAEGDEILVPISSDLRLKIEDLFRPAGTSSYRE